MDKSTPKKAQVNYIRMFLVKDVNKSSYSLVFNKAITKSRSNKDVNKISYSLVFNKAITKSEAIRSAHKVGWKMGQLKNKTRDQ